MLDVGSERCTLYHVNTKIKYEHVKHNIDEFFAKLSQYLIEINSIDRFKRIAKK